MTSKRLFGDSRMMEPPSETRLCVAREARRFSSRTAPATLSSCFSRRLGPFLELRSYRPGPRLVDLVQFGPLHGCQNGGGTEGEHIVQRTQTATQILFPFLRYKDAPAAIDCLAKAFGFEEQTVVQNENGTIAHAEVEFGSGVMMPASARDDELRIKSPRDLGR